MFSGFVHLKYSDSRTFVHIGKSTNIYLDEKYSLQIPDSNSPNESGTKMFRIRGEISS